MCMGCEEIAVTAVAVAYPWRHQILSWFKRMIARGQ